MRRDAARVADRERRIERRRFDRAPQIDDGDGAPKQFVGFVRISDPKARHAGRRRLIDMNATRGLAGNAGIGRAIVLPGTRRLNVWSKTRTSVAPVTRFKRSMHSG